MLTTTLFGLAGDDNNECIAINAEHIFLSEAHSALNAGIIARLLKDAPSAATF